MRKLPMRVYRGYATIGGLTNIEVFYPFSDLGYGRVMFTCKKCGEVYAVDEEHSSKSVLVRFIRDEFCITCDAPLVDTLAHYPETFMAANGEVGHFVVPDAGPPENETVLRDIWLLDR